LIFVSTGSRKHPFDRLIKKLDELAGNDLIQDEIFAQIAETKYIPKNFSYSRYLSAEEFTKCQDEADIIISHAGTGALIGALKKGKQVIAVPRLAVYNEHSDDHQLQISEVLTSGGYLRQVLDMEELGRVIEQCKKDPIVKKYDRQSNIIGIIENFIEKEFFDK